MELIPTLLAMAVLLPLVSFAMILVGGPHLGKHGSFAGTLATLAIVGAGVLSFASLGIWIAHEPPHNAAHHSSEAAAEPHAAKLQQRHHLVSLGTELTTTIERPDPHEVAVDNPGHTVASGQAFHADTVKPALVGDWYTLGQFGKLRLTIGYYVDALTVAMFCMVTLIASCIHFYAIGYMHDELHDVTDHEVHVQGHHLTRPGRYPRFFQSLSLFCFSMLGLVVAGNVLMTFAFWELVGICSYFLIGFYIERQSASTAANKAFIVNRIGDFGMIIGLMALWGGLGTFAFGDLHGQPGLFSLVRPADQHHQLVVPERMAVLADADDRAERLQGDAVPHGSSKSSPGYWLLIVAGLGIFCGCVGKSAQFPLHVWLPDAMEGPTPVSALVHSATMVAAGVFLVARFYPVFTPEVLLSIAIVGTITLFLAATIAITATDIKRVLAYSTVSQLGYMMLALGVGGWLAGVLHLFTHAFFKSLLFMCSGSVIHGVHTNDMTLMGGLRNKMPWTAYTMLIGCLAIAGTGIPFLIGFSGYYSKDAILEQALSFGNRNPGWGHIFFVAAAGGAAVTAFYMFRLWYLTFAGKPRDQHRYDHAHESPPVMYLPLVLLSVFAIGVAWNPREAVLGAILAAGVFLAVAAAQWRRDGRPRGRAVGMGIWGSLALCAVVFLLALIWWPFPNLTLANLLEQARPEGTLAIGTGQLTQLVWPDEHESHAMAIAGPATVVAFSTALGGFLLATVFYGWGILKPEEVRRQFSGIYNLLWNKWWFDELYNLVFVRPTLVLSKWIAAVDRNVIDGLIHGITAIVRKFSELGEAVVDQGIVDGFVNKLADVTYALGLGLRRPQTGKLRQYVLFIVVATIGLFVLASFFWGKSFAG